MIKNYKNMATGEAATKELASQLVDIIKRMDSNTAAARLYDIVLMQRIAPSFTDVAGQFIALSNYKTCSDSNI